MRYADMLLMFCRCLIILDQNCDMPWTRNDEMHMGEATTIPRRNQHQFYPETQISRPAIYRPFIPQFRHRTRRADKEDPCLDALATIPCSPLMAVSGPILRYAGGGSGTEQLRRRSRALDQDGRWLSGYIMNLVQLLGWIWRMKGAEAKVGTEYDSTRCWAWVIGVRRINQGLVER